MAIYSDKDNRRIHRPVRRRESDEFYGDDVTSGVFDDDELYGPYVIEDDECDLNDQMRK